MQHSLTDGTWSHNLQMMMCSISVQPQWYIVCIHQYYPKLCVMINSIPHRTCLRMAILSLIHILCQSLSSSGWRDSTKVSNSDLLCSNLASLSGRAPWKEDNKSKELRKVYHVIYWLNTRTLLWQHHYQPDFSSTGSDMKVTFFHVCISCVHLILRA